MDDVTAVRIPQENVNDEVVTVLEWRVANGAYVEADQLLVEIESSKATFEIPSPHQGVIRIAALRDREVPVGDVLCYVGSSEAAIDAWLARRDATPTLVPLSEPMVESAANSPDIARQVEQTIALVEQTLDSRGHCTPAKRSTESAGPPADSKASPSTTRLSRQARAMVAQRGISESELAGRGLVRASDLAPEPPQAPVDESAHIGDVVRPGDSDLAPHLHQATTQRPATDVPTRTESLSRAKRLEAKLLAWSQHQALRSAVVTTVATSAGNPLRKSRPDAAEFLVGQLIRECGRLLKKYPLFNAYCSDGQVHYYEQVNIGYALDAGHGLKVPVFREANWKETDAIIEERRQFIADYLSGNLRPASLTSATFNITDLSGSGVFLFDPLIVEGQSAILGIGANYLPADNRNIAYNLILAFDHRLIEGRTAARFLNELKETMLVYEQGESGAASLASEVTEPACSVCGMKLTQARSRKHFLVQVADLNPERPHWVCTICLAGR